MMRNPIRERSNLHLDPGADLRRTGQRTANGSVVPSVRLGLRFDPFGFVPASTRAAAIAEAAEIWMPYGVAFTAIEGMPASCADGDLSLDVIFDLEPQADAASTNNGSDGLGHIRFASDGAPEPWTRIHYAAVTRMATSGPVMGLQASQWPARLREEIVARAVGRVLAHEVGHFLLRWPHHAESGLMRGQFRASTLADPDARAFSLTSGDRARFQIVLDAALPWTRTRREAIQAAGACPAI